VRSVAGLLMDRAVRVRNQNPPVPFSSSRVNSVAGLFQFDDSAGNPEQNMSAMGSVGTLFAIVNLTSTAVSALDWKLWRKSADGDPKKRTEVMQHAALDCLNHPNDFYSREELFETSQQHVDLTGEGWWVVEALGAGSGPYQGVPVGLWPVRPDRIEPVPSVEHFIAGYVYKGPDGEKIPLERNQVLLNRMPNPLDPYRGMGPVQSILADAESIKYSMEWNRNFFVNGAEPGGMIKTDHRLNDEEWNELKMRWNEGHRGTSNAHRVGILENVEWVDRKFSHNDMQFAQLRQVSRDSIREAFAIHGHMLGDADDVNLANATAAEVTFARRLIVPRARRWRGLLNNDFLPLFGATAVGLEFDFENPVDEDEKTDAEVFQERAKGVSLLVNAGFDGAAAAAAAGLPEIPFDRENVTQGITEIGGAEKTAPAGGQASDPAAKPAPDKAPTAPGDTPPAPGETTGAKNWRPPQFYNARDPQGGVDLTQVQEAWAHALDALVAQYGAAISPDQRKELVDQVRKIVEDGDLSKLANMTVSTDEASALVEAAMVGLADVSGRHVVQEAARQGVDLEHKTAEVGRLSDLADLTAELLGFGLKISAARTAARAAGVTADAPEVAHQVELALRSLSDASLRSALGGALTTAQNAGRFATMAAGPEAAMYASEINDRNTCPPCNAVDGRWLGNTTDMGQVNSMYPSSGYIDCEGGEKCRGTVVAVWRPTVQGEGSPEE